MKFIQILCRFALFITIIFTIKNIIKGVVNLNDIYKTNYDRLSVDNRMFKKSNIYKIGLKISRTRYVPISLASLGVRDFRGQLQKVIIVGFPQFALGISFLAGSLAPFGEDAPQTTFNVISVIGWIGGLAWLFDVKNKPDIHNKTRIAIFSGLPIGLIVGLFLRFIWTR